MQKNTLPYGSWPSTITAPLIASAGVSAFDPSIDGNAIYWLESRPQEGGRVALMRSQNGAAASEVTPKDMNVRTRVHEYGGAPYLATNGLVFVVNFADQEIYRLEADGTSTAITNNAKARYADMQLDAKRNRLICIRETHDEGQEPKNEIVAISLVAPHGQSVLATGYDFVAFPRLSADGSTLAFIAWNHPNMPWDNVSLMVSEVNEAGTTTHTERLNEGIDESVLDPKWSSNGHMLFLADRSGWWNPHSFEDDQIIHLIEQEDEFGGPLWSLGQNKYGFISEDIVVFGHDEDGQGMLTLFNLVDRTTRKISVVCASIGNIVCADGKAVFEAGFDDNTPALMSFDLASGAFDVVARPSPLPIEQDTISKSQAIEFPTANGLTAHAYFYAPVNPVTDGPEGDKPPLIVKIHGGPTGQSSGALQLAIQFWTSRGFAFVDINYGGSTGYGRAYRQRLNGKWGITDLEDTVHCVQYLADQGLIDPDKAAIRGGSAGGYTTLAALAFSDVFKAGANYYGVSDLEALAKDTHKFESRYLDNLIGPYPAAKDVYEARSPIHHLDGFNQPLIVFQGAEDKIVPPNQSEAIVNVLKEKGIPVAYLLFDGEQHGFRKAENTIRSLEAELYFYGQIFGFTPADEIEPVDIMNHQARG